MKTLKKVLVIIADIILWLVILLAALFAITTLTNKKDGQVGNVLGFTPMTVMSPSMKPVFDEGDLIVIKTCDTKALQKDDIVTFHTIIDNEYALNTHRIIEIKEENGVRTFTTKGDNNDIADQRFISEGDIVGKYQFKLPFLGKVITFLSTSMGFLIVIVLPLLLFFIYQIYHLIMVSINLKKAIAEEEAAAKNEADAAKNDEVMKAKAEAEAALEEARRLKAEAEAIRAGANKDAADDKGAENNE